ncbi:CRP-like cAMP-binding protein [Neorhizobium galegae]|uniref:cyclic nucleotide-binding domain-containing protein n=1 Tax=Neorhizobium galegae TaxID=399 RepID=UPI001AE807DE|nr:cyclic nucleotide-binding domain-containing protein [Neorhizobium galegae]MBP2551535.1 CRP-like cAMP-binding protein [Neorhizobium galegae]
MLLNDEVKLLQKLPYFSKVDACKLKLLAFASDRVCYDAGQVMFRQGDSSDAAYVLLRGKADLVVDTVAGEKKVGEAHAHSMVGEMCLLSEAPRGATARVTEPLEALRISRDCFLKVVSHNPQVSFQISRSMAETIRDAARAPGQALAKIPGLALAKLPERVD